MRGYKGTHRKPRASKRRIGTVAAVSAAALSAGVSQAAPAVQAAEVTPSHPAAHYTVASGDTLSQIAARTLGDAGLWPQIAHRNGLSSTLIYPGQVLSLGDGAAPTLSRAPVAPATYHHAFRPHYNLAAGTGEHAGTYSHAGLENIWMAAGGSAAAAPKAACIAERESGGRASAVSPWADYGLWQELNRPDALDPGASARIAVQMSHNGRSWADWSTAAGC